MQSPSFIQSPSFPRKREAGQAETGNFKQNTDKTTFPFELTNTENQTAKAISPSGGTDPSSESFAKKQSYGGHNAAFRLSNEIRLSNNPVSVNQKGIFADIPYTKLSLDYSLNLLDFFMEMELSSPDKLKVNLSELRLTRSFKTLPLQLSIGYLPLPLGYLSENGDRFLRDMSLHKALTRREEDTGLTVQINLWKQYVYLQISCFGGSVKRESEDFYRGPDTPPFIVSLKTTGVRGEGFVTWFQKDTAFFNPLRAVGGGGRLSHSLSSINFKVSLQGELWQKMEKSQTSRAWYLFPQIEFFDKWRAGFVLGDISHFSPSMKNPQAKNSLYERVLQISWRAHPALTLTAERFITGQKKGPLRDSLWAVRAQTQFEF